MEEKNSNANSREDDLAFRRRIKYAMYAFAIVEFLVTAIIVYQKVAR